MENDVNEQRNTRMFLELQERIETDEQLIELLRQSNRLQWRLNMILAVWLVLLSVIIIGLYK